MHRVLITKTYTRGHWIKRNSADGRVCLGRARTDVRGLGLSGSVFIKQGGVVWRTHHQTPAGVRQRTDEQA